MNISKAILMSNIDDSVHSLIEAALRIVLLMSGHDAFSGITLTITKVVNQEQVCEEMSCTWAKNTLLSANFSTKSLNILHIHQYRDFHLQE
jgi:hypothetical protein